MKIRSAIWICPVLISVIFLTCNIVFSQEVASIPLPKPQMDGGRPLMQVLKDRRTARAFSAEILSPQVLSNLLWAVFGVNRPETGGRTAPSAMNWQEMDIYVAKADGAFLYDAKTNALKPILSEDIRALTGSQAFVKDAPVNLIYVADLARASRGSAEDKTLYTAANAGFISQNVYLYCASEGLATVVRGTVDRTAVAKALKLRPEQKIILAQTVGKPKQP